MNDVPNNTGEEHKAPVTIAGGMIMTMEGGEEDNTERPSRFLYRTDKPTLNRPLLENGQPVFPPGPTVPPSPPDAERAAGKPEPRDAGILRETAETRIRLSLNLDGSGEARVATGVGFFDHMLTLLAKHSLISLSLEACGDLDVDAHHTVEDTGICFGLALAKALGDKAGIRRYGDATVPMDETLVTAAVDLSGRPCLVWKADVPHVLLGTFAAELAEEFWRAFANNAGCNLHVVLHHGRNTHHIVEGVFKAVARALRQAVEKDPRVSGVPSTKGTLA
jgi:imidazoleglycerol-phosphate dehydratase